MPLQFRRGLATDRTSITPVAGEPLYTTDTKKLYIGDGTTAGGVVVSAGIDGSGTTNTIAYWVDSDTLGALATATYPSLTELSYVKGVTSAIQTQLDGKVDENSAITGATKTKITYDAKGLVTAGADATTADISDSSNKRYVTDADLTKLSNLSGTNTGDQNLFSTIAVSGQSNVVADSTSDTLTLVAGSNVSITTNATSDEVTISATVPVNGSGTTDQITYWVDSDTLGALSTTTYPSLTELSYVKGVTSAIQTQLDGKVDENTAITGDTKTKITYDSKGLVTAGADATTADISDSTNKRYVTDSDLTKLSNLSGTNTGDQNIFSTVSVSGQSDVVADSTSDTITLASGTGISITTNATTDTVTIATSGVPTGSGAANKVAFWSGTSTLSSDTDLHWDSTNNRLGIEVTSPTYKLDISADTGGQLQLREQNGTHYLRFNINDSNETSISCSSTEISFDKPIGVPDSVYGAGWNGSLLVPTRNAVYDKIESLGIFSTVAVSGQSNVVADSTSDTLTLVAGSNVTITTDATTDSITISSTASGVIDGSGASNKLAIWSDSDTLTSDTNLHWDTTNDRLGIKTATPNTSLQVAGGTHVTKELAVGLFNWEGDSAEGRIMISGSLGEMSIFDRALSTRTNTNAGDRFVQYNSSKLFRIYTDVNNDILTLSASGSLGLGIGSASASARLHAISTTEQLRLGYDTSNYLTATVSSTGVVTFDAVGSGKSFLFVEPSFTAIPTITTAADGTLTINVANTEFAERTGLTATTTIETTGTAINGQKLIIRLKDNGTSRSLTWNAIFVQGGPSLPTTTTAGKWMHLGFIYNSTTSKWMLVASSVEA